MGHYNALNIIRISNIPRHPSESKYDLLADFPNSELMQLTIWPLTQNSYTRDYISSHANFSKGLCSNFMQDQVATLGQSISVSYLPFRNTWLNNISLGNCISSRSIEHNTLINIHPQINPLQQVYTYFNNPRGISLRKHHMGRFYIEDPENLYLRKGG